MLRIAFAGFLLTIFASASGLAAPVNRLAFTPGPLPDDGDLPGGDRSWPQATREMIATPIFADLTGDGTPEVIAADDMNIYAYTFERRPSLVAERRERSDARSG